jgi:hypothetical protein
LLISEIIDGVAMAVGTITSYDRAEFAEESIKNLKTIWPETMTEQVEILNGEDVCYFVQSY